MYPLENYLAKARRSLLNLPFPNSAQSPTFDKLGKVIKDELKKFYYFISNQKQAKKLQQN